MTALRTHTDLLGRIAENRIVPVVVAQSVSEAAVLADALVEGGLPVAEITFRTSAAADVIRALANDGRLLVGAGTVITAEQVDVAVEAGAQFIVSPGLVRSVVERANDLGILVIPGISTATEAIAAIELGLRVVKFFPAESSGGAAAVRAFASVFPDLRFIPTGGIDAGRAGDYLSIPSVIAVGGSWMLPRREVTEANVSALREIISAAVSAVRPSAALS
jgi:2-dehydro-3-deoxyphosphogluconate aldolase/(4S)-4-hydroxy-2-oxoglutarate aldolase